MISFALDRWLAFVSLLAFAFTQTACGSAEAPDTPVYEFIIEADKEVVADLEGADEQFDDLVRSSEKVIRERFGDGSDRLRSLTYLGDGRLALEVSGTDAKNAVETVIGVSGNLYLREVMGSALADSPAPDLKQPGTILVSDREGVEVFAVSRVGGVRGRNVTSASPGIDQMTGEAVVNIRMDATGRARFASLTRANVGGRIAVVMDSEVLMAPYILEPVEGGEVQISGGLTPESAQELSVIINSGALPSPFKILSQRRMD